MSPTTALPPPARRLRLPVPEVDLADLHSAPKRVQLSRAAGWRMPNNTLKVDRTTKWGNPFIVGKHGTTAECVELFSMMVSGYVCISKGADLARAQSEFLKAWAEHREELRGKNLACWCRAGSACHADVLIELANAELRGRPAGTVPLE